MIEFIAVEISAIFLTTLYLLNRYAAKDISILTKILILIPWFLCFLIIILVPLDVYFVNFKMYSFFTHFSRQEKKQVKIQIDKKNYLWHFGE